MICFYHSKDLDGYCSGAIIKHKYPDAKLIGYDYGQPFPIDLIGMGESVIMIDVSLPMHGMNDIAELSKDFTWIDHHASAIKDFQQFCLDNKGSSGLEKYGRIVLEDGISACEGGWKYLFPNEFMPQSVILLGRYDTWRNGDKEKWDNEIMPFQYGMRMVCSSAETFPQELLQAHSIVDEKILDIIHDGKNILSYQKTQNERACKSCFEFEFEGLRAICLNNGGANSQVFESVYDESKHDIMMPFVFTGKHWTFSMYTTKDEIDCSVIAKSKGGGGHKKAAGFQVKEIQSIFPFLNSL